MARYENEKADIINGRPRSPSADGLSLLNLCNKFLLFKRNRINVGKLTMRSWYDYQVSCERIMRVFGPHRAVETLRPDDFERLYADYAKTWKAVRLGNEVNRARILFLFAFENDLIVKPIKFGPGFVRPSHADQRKIRAKDRQLHGARMFTPVEL